MMRMSVKTRCHTGQNFSQGQNAHNAAVNRLIEPAKSHTHTHDP